MSDQKLPTLKLCQAEAQKIGAPVVRADYTIVWPDGSRLRNITCRPQTVREAADHMAGLLEKVAKHHDQKSGAEAPGAEQ